MRSRMKPVMAYGTARNRSDPPSQEVPFTHGSGNSRYQIRDSSDISPLRTIGIVKLGVGEIERG